MFAIETCDVQFSATSKIGANYSLYSFKVTINNCFKEININININLSTECLILDVIGMSYNTT